MMALTPPEHERSEAVVMAAQWLAEQNPAPQPIIPIMKERFGLNSLQASEACAMATRFRTYRKAHG